LLLFLRVITKNVDHKRI